MTPEQKITHQNSQNTAAMIEAMGMQAENSNRLSKGETIAYGDEAFFKLIDKYGLDWHSVHNFLVMD